MAFLGVDIGTSCCKAVAFDASGAPLSAAKREYSVVCPAPGRAELDSEAVIEFCFETIAEAAAKSKEPIQALAISSQGEAFTPVDAQGRPLANAMVSSDCRAASLVDEFSNSFGRERLYRITGHTPSPLFSLFKLLWLKRNERRVWDASVKFLCFEDLLQARLGVEPGMGWPLAGRTMLFDVLGHRWSPEILDALELDERKLARPLPGGSVVGEVAPEIAARLGLPRGVEVVSGGHDQTIAALGSGACEAGSAMYAAGTVECLCPVFAKAQLSPELMRANLCCYDYSLSGLYCSVAYSLTGGNLLRYLLEQFADSPRDGYESFLKRLPAEPTRLLALPYLTPSGTPYFDVATPGAVLGLRLDTGKFEIAKALLEGVALEMKLNLSLLKASGVNCGRLLASGGGTRDRALLQMKTDVLGIPMERLKIDELGCFGAAKLAASAILGESPAEVLNDATAKPDVFEPDPRKSSIYDGKFERYAKLYAGLKKLSGEIFGRN